MLSPSSKVSTLLILFVLLTACSTDANVPQPTQKAVAVEEPTAAPVLVPSPLPTVPPPIPPTPVPSATPEDPELNRKFGVAVQDYVRESWGGWDEGEFIGQCLIDKATSITATAREAVVQHGIDEAFDEVSGTHLQSLSTVWNLCKSESETTASPSDSGELAINCSLDDAKQQVTCEASGYVEDARLYWWTNSEQAEGEGGTFAFTITRARPDLSIMFEECKSGTCQTVTTTLDTAHLMPPKPATEPPTPTTQATITPKSFTPEAATPVTPSSAFDGDACITDRDPQLVFTHEVVPLEHIRHTAPPGSVIVGMLKRHMYFFVGDGIPVQEWSGYPRSVPVFAPVESWLRTVNVYQNNVAGKQVLEYEFIFEATCEVWYRLGHLGPLSERIEALGPFQVGYNRVETPLHVDGGELVSYWSGVNPGGNMDLGVFNTTVEQVLANPSRASDGYHDQQRYEDCPLDYFPDELRSKYYSMLSEEDTRERVNTTTCRRSADQDIAGTISGEWFVPEKYGSVMAIGTSLLGSARITYSRMSHEQFAEAFTISVSPNDQTYIHPTQVTSEHCYQSPASDAYVYLELVSPTDLQVEYGTGTCADRTPTITFTVER